VAPGHSALPPADSPLNSTRAKCDPMKMVASASAPKINQEIKKLYGVFFCYNYFEVASLVNLS